MAKPTTSNKGRITRPDQAYAAAVRENEQRAKDASPADEQAERDAVIVGRLRNTDHAQAWDEAYRIAAERDAIAPEPARVMLSLVPTVAQHYGLVPQPVAAPVPVAPQVAAGLAIPIRFLQAALVACAKDDIRYYLNGVYLHGVDGELRIVSTDGHRMLVSRFAPEVPLPAWINDGAILPRSDLAACLPLLDKNATFDGRQDPHGSALVDCAIDAEGKRTVTLSATNGFCAFRLRLLDGKFPDYQRILDGPNIGALLAGQVERAVMETSAFNTRYLRGATDIAARLGADAIHSFIGDSEVPGLFTFSKAPDTLLIIMPVRGDAAVSSGVVKMLGSNAISGSVAALRAHMTRTVKALGSATTEREREQLEAKRLSFEQRIAGLLGDNAPKQNTNRATA